MMLIDVGSRIKELREKAKLSARRLAKLTGHDPCLISKIESGVNKPSLDSLEKICGVLGISLSDFFSGDLIPLPPDLFDLLEIVQEFTPEERKKLTQLLEEFGMGFTKLFIDENEDELLQDFMKLFNVVKRLDKNDREALYNFLRSFKGMHTS
jgi:transcriptional regulator with XRE-family HTH domain